MQYRQLPPAGNLEDIETVWRAVPETPEETDDCCRRLCDRTPVETRDHASEWLVFLTALGCVADDGAGYYRREDSIDVDTLRTQFEANIFGVRTALETLESADRPLTGTEIADRVEPATRKRFERAGNDSEYLDRLLHWAVVFEHVASTADGYVAPE